jgi:hypothetical protein
MTAKYRCKPETNPILKVIKDKSMQLPQSNTHNALKYYISNNIIKNFHDNILKNVESFNSTHQSNLYNKQHPILKHDPVPPVPLDCLSPSKTNLRGIFNKGLARKLKNDKKSFLKAFHRMGANIFDNFGNIIRANQDLGPGSAKFLHRLQKEDAKSGSNRTIKYELKDLISKKRRSVIALESGIWREVYLSKKFPKPCKSNKGKDFEGHLILYSNKNFYSKAKMGVWAIFEGHSHGNFQSKLTQYISDTTINALSSYLSIKDTINQQVIEEAINYVHQLTEHKILKNYYMDAYKSGCSISITILHADMIYTSNLGTCKTVLVSTQQGDLPFGAQVVQKSQTTRDALECDRITDSGGLIDHVRDKYGDSLEKDKVFIPKDGSDT